MIDNEWVLEPGLHLAICLDCDPIIPDAFAAQRDRDAWAKQHTAGSGHQVAKGQAGG